MNEMQYFKKPWTLCTDISTVIVLCSILIRVLSIWYVVGGFILKFDEPLLSVDGIAFLNNVFLGSLPLGSFINGLVLSLLPSIIIHTVNAAVTFFGICRKMKGCLIASATINILMIIYHFLTIVLTSWLIDEMESSIYRQLKRTFDIRSDKYIPEMNCCGFDIDRTPCVTVPTSLPPCFDYIKEKLKAYGGSFIAVLVANILVSAVMVIGTEYLFRYEQVKSKQSQDSNLRNIIEKSELYNSRNGMYAKISSFLKGSWERNILASKFGYLSVIVIMLDGGIILAIIFVRYNLYDLTMSEEFSSIYAYGKVYINMGYLKDALLITFICLLIWSIVAKVFYFTGIYLNKKCLLAAFMCSEILVLAVECIIFALASYLLRVLYCCDWNRTGLDSCPFSYGFTTPLPICDRSWTNAAKFTWFSIWILILHIFLKIFYIARADNVYKHTMTKADILERKTVVQKSGFFYNVYLSSKRHPLTAAVIGVSILICIISCVFFSGLVVVRYGKPSYSLLTDSLHAIRLGSLDMSANRDNAILISVVSLSVLFCLQCGKFISIGLMKPKVTLLILWSELPLFILHLCSAAMTIILLKLVHCCSDDTDCLFSVNSINSLISSTEFCDSHIREHADLQFRLMLGFGILNIILQFLSLVLGYVYFKRSADGKLGIFKGVSELFKSIWCELRRIRMLRMLKFYIQRFTKVVWQKIEGKLQNYTIIQRIFLSLQILILILNFLFWIGLFRMALYPGYLPTSGLMRNTSNVKLSFGFGNIGTTVFGIIYSLIAVVPTTSFYQLLGVISLIAHKRDLFKMFTVSVVGLSIGDLIYLVFSSEVLHFGYCYCKNSSACESYNMTAVGPVKETCRSLFLEPAGVLVAYLVASFIIHVSYERFYARVGIVVEKRKLKHQRSQQNSVVHKNNKSEAESLSRNPSELKEETTEDANDEKALVIVDSSKENAQDKEINHTDKTHTMEEENRHFEILRMDDEMTERKEQYYNMTGDVQNVDTGHRQREHAEHQIMNTNERNDRDDQNETIEKNEKSGEAGGETASINDTEGDEKKKKKGRKNKDKKRREQNGEEHDMEQTNELDSATQRQEDEDKTDELKIEDMSDSGAETSWQDSGNTTIEQQ
ncbi:uncharacterized protein LOC133191309 [Saccostrea echinata]|uniref:uncharacterized protein LOC133191309 n=1 Tax=Saccostrea echinata TaxID=191078 RepID=UPI002A83CEE4|nr:uncharacterized protein LOC133191309 [Saccostrea echinata]